MKAPPCRPKEDSVRVMSNKGGHDNNQKGSQKRKW
jgi:hypothetical protein